MKTKQQNYKNEIRGIDNVIVGFMFTSVISDYQHVRFELTFPSLVRYNLKKNDKQRSTKHTHKTKDRATRTTPKTGGRVGGTRVLLETFRIFCSFE
jgi:hypothetical protein